MARGDDLVLKVSADTEAVASGLKPMDKALSNLEADAQSADKQLRKLDSLHISPDIDMSDLDKAQRELDATGDAMRQLSRQEIVIDVRQQAIDKAQADIRRLRDQIAENILLGLDTRAATREIGTLQASIRRLTDTPQRVEVEVDVDEKGIDEGLSGIEGLREGVNETTNSLEGLGEGMSGIPGIAMAMIPALADLNETLVDHRNQLEASGRSVGRFGRAAAGLTGFMAGPWGLAVAAGVGLLALFAESTKEADEETQDFSESIDYQTGALDRNNRMKAATELSKKGYLTTLKELGLSTREFTAALAGDEVAATRSKEAMAELERRLLLTGQGYTFVNDATGAHTVAVSEQAKKLESLQLEFGKLIDNNSTAAQTQKDINNAVGGTNEAADDAATSVGDLAEATERYGRALSTHEAVFLAFSDQMKDSRTELDKLIGSLDLFNGRTATSNEAMRTYQQDLDDVTEALKENGKTVNKQRTELDLNSEAGRENSEMLDKMAKDIDTLRTARLSDMETSGETTDAIMADYQKQRIALIKTAESMGLSHDAAVKYVDEILKIPNSMDTKVTVSNIDAEEARLEKLARDRAATITVELNIDKWKLNQVRRQMQEIEAGNLGPSASAMSAPVAPAPSMPPIFIQPRLYVDSRPLVNAMRGDIEMMVSANSAATRTRGRL